METGTPVKVGTRFCICYKELIPWVMLPLQIAYVTDGESDKSKMFAFGSGTLQGHLLVGTHTKHTRRIDMLAWLCYVLELRSENSGCGVCRPGRSASWCR